MAELLLQSTDSLIGLTWRLRHLFYSASRDFDVRQPTPLSQLPVRASLEELMAKCVPMRPSVRWTDRLC